MWRTRLSRAALQRLIDFCHCCLAGDGQVLTKLGEIGRHYVVVKLSQGIAEETPAVGRLGGAVNQKKPHLPILARRCTSLV